MSLSKIRLILADILNISEGDIEEDTDLVRGLAAESIDLLEIAMSIEKEFGIRVDENRMFLKSFRFHVNRAKEEGKEDKDIISFLKSEYPFLNEDRIRELIKDAQTNIIPSIKVKDLASYVQWKLGTSHKEEEEYKEI